MSVAIITGSAGLIGAEAVRLFAQKGFDIVGIDNDMRGYFFGSGASTTWSRDRLKREIKSYTHITADIRDFGMIESLFRRYGRAVAIVIHTAAQPSHDWAAHEPITDFTVNANGTLNLLECTRRHSPGAPFIFTSTNKVYGDTPNRLPIVEFPTRWEVAQNHPFFEKGIDETMGIDHSLHSLFGASKIAADVLVQEYGRYFGMSTACFRCGCVTGPNHSGAQSHGFLAYLVRCAVTDQPYTVFGYKAKQVRDNIHSYDVVHAFWQFFRSPRSSEVYNIGGGRFSNASMLEAIAALERLTGRSIRWTYSEMNRKGDHIWWISDTTRIQTHYPLWKPTYGISSILQELHETLRERLA